MRCRSGERWELALKRLVRILARHGVANARTLEQKISDAGPYNQRIDPHVLTDARKSLLANGSIKKICKQGISWFYLEDTSMGTVTERLEEQLLTYRRLRENKFSKRLGQCLEIAIYRALLGQKALDHLGSFTDLEEHDDNCLYSKEEPPRNLSGKRLAGKQRLDFLVHHPEAGWAGIEAKNVRAWLYPDRKEIKALLEKAVALDCVPVLIARRIHFVTFKLLHSCGVVIHETYNQLMPKADRELAEKARDKQSLGYHDIRLGNQPNDRLVKFIEINLPKILPKARNQFDQYKDLLGDFADNTIDYEEFAARVRRRSEGVDEDWDQPQNEEDF